LEEMMEGGSPEAITEAQEKIREMTRRIVERFDPEKVILFGSHARGEAGPDSDVDLLVVMPVAGSKREKGVEIGVALHDIRIPKDIIVTTPEAFEWRKEVVGTIERPAAREGKVLYARAGRRSEDFCQKRRSGEAEWK
jgi:predicted nucleotidyltransferase